VILPVTEPSHAVFLSYASQDAEAAQKICDGLRAAGIEVFLDQSELRGGDVWDQKIRREIHDCALFIPVISANTASRHEGYFRLEWDLADQRTHMIARSRVFVVPVCLDATTQVAADVPESFQRVQWTRLPGGETPPAFVERIKRLLSPQVSPVSAVPGASPATREPVRATARSRPVLLAIVAVVVCAALAYLVADRFWVSRHPGTSAGDTASRATAELGAAAAFNPPPHSIAVLPFINMSGDKEQEYFSEGLTEELLNSLTEIDGLQVAGRASAFSFQGKDTDLGTIAHKLNVGAILEGSVRRSGHTVRITAQLINAITGFHLWSKAYDRDLGDVLNLQTEIATAVADALKVTLLSDVSAKIELGGTLDAGAFDAYLRGSSVFQSRHGPSDLPSAIAAYTDAVRLDPNYALAFAGRSLALTIYTAETGVTIREGFEKAESDARRAIALAPGLAQAHAALAYVSEQGTLDFARAREENERALALAPGNVEVLNAGAQFAARMGDFDAAIAAARRAVVLDPLGRISHSILGRAFYLARRYKEAEAAFATVIHLNPNYTPSYGERGLAFYELGDLEDARASCEIKRDFWLSQQCLAVVYDKLGRDADAEAEVAKIKAALGDAEAYQYAATYAQWGNYPRALDWLDNAMRLRDSGLVQLKTDPLMDPLRQEPRFRAIERDLKFPN
jgi:TolB-like protein/tetratricopeptide (TPR) repeat protein